MVVIYQEQRKRHLGTRTSLTTQLMDAAWSVLSRNCLKVSCIHQVSNCIHQVSLWMPVDPVSLDSAVKFVRGSHRYYL